jgi:predicted RNase H-like HicB family nuclease
MNCEKVYPVIISPDGDGYVVHVPDFDRGTQGDNIAEAIMMAKDLIGLMGITYEDNGKPVPKPSTKEPAHEPGEMVAWVDVDFKRYRIMHDQKTVRINISIPRYLKALGEEAGINFSRELQERLVEKLAV